jgi:transposase-like protein
LVLETLNSQRSDAEIARAYGVHPITLSKWKRHFLDHGFEIFSSNREKQRYEHRIAELERLIGQKEIDGAE